MSPEQLAASVEATPAASPVLPPPIPPYTPEDTPEPESNGDSKSQEPSGTSKVTARYSVWDYLTQEIYSHDYDTAQDEKEERISNFLSVPVQLEKLIDFGWLVCLDSYLYVVTILPIRFAVALTAFLRNSWRRCLQRSATRLRTSQKCDLIKGALIGTACAILAKVDASTLYHSVRGQEAIKLYVIFNVLEIADRLCCSFGQDLQDSLFSRNTLARRQDGRQPYLRGLFYFALSLGYCLAHVLVLFYQVVTLNVAINSYSNALLTLLMSNQFVEIKGSVFKKFEKENLFQMSCADIVERFQLSLFMAIIAFRNLVEISGSSIYFSNLSSHWWARFVPNMSVLETVLSPLVIVLASEMFVDWLKHAFITKFNHIRPSVYARFMDILCRDLVTGNQHRQITGTRYVDQSPIVARRLGFAVIPLICLSVRAGSQIFHMLSDSSQLDDISMEGGLLEEAGLPFRAAGSTFSPRNLLAKCGLPPELELELARSTMFVISGLTIWLLLVLVKVVLGMRLLSFAHARYLTMHKREIEDRLNAKDRQEIGINASEREYNRDLRRFLETTPMATRTDHRAKTGDAYPNRYEMVKSRIW